LVESKPAIHNVPAHPKRRISRWLALFAFVVIAAGSTTLWLESSGFETTDDAQVDGHFDCRHTRGSRSVPALAAL
jgi:multidrug resistance efflux pump